MRSVTRIGAGDVSGLSGGAPMDFVRVRVREVSLCNCVTNCDTNAHIQPNADDRDCAKSIG